MAAAITKPTRAEEVRQERRRKPGSNALNGIKLGLDEEKVDRTQYTYRFVRDEGNRVQQLYAQDWDRVTEKVKDDSNGLGSVTSAHGGLSEEGKPYNMVLLKKRKDWFEEDQKAKMQPLDEMEQAIRRGTDHQSGKLDLRGPGVYTPGQNTIG